MICMRAFDTEDLIMSGVKRRRTMIVRMMTARPQSPTKPWIVASTHVKKSMNQSHMVSSVLYALGNGIVSAGMEGVTPQYPFGRQKRPFECSVLRDGLKRVFGTGRRVDATGAK